MISAITVAAPLIAAASNQKIFFAQLDAASFQEQPLIKNIFLTFQRLNWKSFLSFLSLILLKISHILSALEGGRLQFSLYLHAASIKNII